MICVLNFATSAYKRVTEQKNMTIPHSIFFPQGNNLPFLAKGIWYVGESGGYPEKEFTFPGWDHPEVFGTMAKPLHIEYCSGNGSWIAEKATAHPEIHWVAIERKCARVKKIWSKAQKMKLSNLFVIWAEGHFVTSRFFSNNSIASIFINFPDPWPKRKHAKHRLIQPAFAKELARILIENGTLTLVTDDVAYSTWAIQVFTEAEGLAPCYSHPFYTTSEENYGSSYFDTLWRAKGRAIRNHRFIKIKSNPKNI